MTLRWALALASALPLASFVTTLGCVRAGLTEVQHAGRDASAAFHDGESAGVDSALDAGKDATVDSGLDAEPDAGLDAEPDAGPDAGTDAGPAFGTEWVFTNTEMQPTGGTITLRRWDEDTQALPNNGDPTTGVRMTGNLLLLHFDGPLGDVADGTVIQENSGIAGNLVVAQNPDGTGLAFAQGMLNQALSFEAGDDGVTVMSGPAVPSVLNEASISLWLFYEAASSGVLLQYGDATNGFSLRTSSVGHLTFDADGSSVQLSSGPLRFGRWQHIAVVADASGVQFYVDGSPWEHFDVMFHATPSARVFSVGQGLLGKVDDLALWDRALGAGEIETIYQRQQGPWGGGLLGTAVSPIEDRRTATPTFISWLTRAPYKKPLLNNLGEESVAYPEGLIDPAAMRGLWHFDGSGLIAEGQALADGSNQSGVAFGRNGDNAGLHFGEGVIGDAICFDAVDDYVDLPLAAIEGVTDFTFSAWVNWGGHVLNAETEWQRIFDFGENRQASNNVGEYFFLTPLSDNYDDDGGLWVSASLRGVNSADTVKSSVFLRATHWEHVAFVLEGDAASIYDDGQLLESGTISIRPSDLTLETNWLGRSHFAADAYFKGCLDEVAIWGRALSSAEISSLYQRGVASVRLQVRACSGDPGACKDLPFVGPDGTTATFFTEAGSLVAGSATVLLPPALRQEFLQYVVFLDSLNSRTTPEVFEVSFE